MPAKPANPAKTKPTPGSDYRICQACEHLREYGGLDLRGWHCAAFPAGERDIPALILLGDHDHRDEYPGDHGIRFSLRDGFDDPYGDAD
jgi:hypothetical protein